MFKSVQAKGVPIALKQLQRVTPNCTRLDKPTRIPRSAPCVRCSRPTRRNAIPRPISKTRTNQILALPGKAGLCASMLRGHHSPLVDGATAVVSIVINSVSGSVDRDRDSVSASPTNDLGERRKSGYRNRYRAEDREVPAADVDRRQMANDLQRVIRAWTELPEPIRQAILTLVDVSRSP